MPYRYYPPELLWQTLCRAVRRRTLQFPDNGMEDLYERCHCLYACQLCLLWCALGLVLYTALLFVRFTEFGFWANATPSAIVQQVLPLGLLVVLGCCLYFSRPFGTIGRHAEWLMCLTTVALLVLVFWTAHDLIDTTIAGYSGCGMLRSVRYAIERQPQAQADLTAFIQLTATREQLAKACLHGLLLLDLLQLLGLSWPTVIAYVSLPVILLFETFFCDSLSENVPESILFAVAIVYYSLATSFHMVTIRRRQFEVDHGLQAALEREAAGEREAAQREKALRASTVEADSILNHLLKNVMADAAGCIYLHLEAVVGPRPHDLVQAMGCLERGMAWCRKRQALLRITSREYQPNLVPVALLRFGEGLIQGREHIACSFVDAVVFMDPIICEVVLDNAINNALRHGLVSQERPVEFTMAIEDAEPLCSDPDRRQLTFEITNHVCSSRPPLTPAVVDDILAGQHIQHGAVLSEHLGLKHLFLAADAHHMDLKLEQRDDVVTLRASIKVRVEGSSAGPGTAAVVAGGALPRGLRVACLDDSDVARRLLHHLFTKVVPTAELRIFGEAAGDIEDFQRAALRGMDIIIVDNQLTYGQHHFEGSALLADLRARGYGGFSCVRSGDVGPEDEAKYRRCGAHCVLGKDVPPAELLRTLCAAYDEFVRRPAAPPAAPDEDAEVVVAPSCLLLLQPLSEGDCAVELSVP